jgi:bis(5'-nucleosidyl)-tetraphosphatase
MTISEYSYGIVPFCKHEKEWKVFLIQHSRVKYWGFPKGHAEQGESPKEAATRELLEETNLRVVRFLSEKAQEGHYHYILRGQLINKVVSLFAAEVEGEIKLQEKEVSAGQWFSIKEAIAKLTYDLDKTVCQQAALQIDTEID